MLRFQNHIDGTVDYCLLNNITCLKYLAIKRKTINTAEMQSIPGVGPSIAHDLCQLGIRRVADLKGRDPEKLYLQSCNKAGKQIDRCLLYVYRCAVYYASVQKHDPKLLKWWNWKDEIVNNKKRG